MSDHTLDGTFLLSDMASTVTAFKNHDWVSVGLMGVADTLDVAATVSDPFGSLFAAGFGWLEDHFEPLKGWLNDLTGDSGAVEALAGRWEEVAASLGESAGDLRTRVHIDLADMEGLAIDAYRGYIDRLASMVESLKEGAEGVASAVKYAAMLVEIVHGIVRDTIAQLAGALASYAMEFAFSLGTATPLIIEQCDTRVSAMAAKIGSTVKELVSSCHALEELVTKLDGVIGKIRSFLGDLHPGAARGRHSAPWLSDRPIVPAGSASHAGPIKSIGERYQDVGTTEVLYNTTTEGYVGQSNYDAGDDDSHEGAGETDGSTGRDPSEPAHSGR